MMWLQLNAVLEADDDDDDEREGAGRYLDTFVVMLNIKSEAAVVTYI